MGNLLCVHVHAGNIHNTKGGVYTFEKALYRYPTLIGVRADQGYRGTFRTRLHKHMRTSFRQILPQTALKILAGRKPACGFLPTLQQNYARKSAHISYEDRFLFIQALLHIRRFKKSMVKDKSDCGCDDLRNRECEPEPFQSEP